MARRFDRSALHLLLYVDKFGASEDYEHVEDSVKVEDTPDQQSICDWDRSAAFWSRCIGASWAGYISPGR